MDTKENVLLHLPLEICYFLWHCTTSGNNCNLPLLELKKVRNGNNVNNNVNNSNNSSGSKSSSTEGLRSVYCVSGTVPNASHLTLVATINDSYYYYSCAMGKDTEEQFI